jgi:hypothetical protein
MFMVNRIGDTMQRQIRRLTAVLLVLITGCSVRKPPASAPTALSSATPAENRNDLTTAPTVSSIAAPTRNNVDSTGTPGTAGDDGPYEQGLIEAADDDVATLTGATTYDLDVTISESYDTVTGQETIHYVNREDTNLEDIYFRLFPNVTGGAIRVSDVTVDGAGVTPALEYADSALRVPLPHPLAPSDAINVSLAFTVTVPQEMAGNYGLFGYFDDVLVLNRFYPVIPVYDDEGWNVEIPPRSGDLTHYDASFYDVQVTAPAAMTLVASGIDMARETEDGWQAVRFTAGPARDFYLAGSERFTLQSTTIGETTVNSYVVDTYAGSADDALNVAVNALEIYNARFVPYPYTEFDVVSMPMLALGIEYPGIIGIRLGLYDPDDEVSGTPTSVLLESVIVHEVAHQWFYNLVGNDEIDEPWLDEAVVQYATGLYYRDLYGESAEQGYRQSWINRWERIGREQIPIGLPSGAYEPEAYAPIVYGRGPLFINSLAETMGEPTFNAFMRDYVAAHRWEVATAEDFRTQAEAHCNCDLDPLFDEWVNPR